MAHLLDRLTAAEVTHVFVFCHGWNTDWSGAVKLYDSLVTGLLESRRQHGSGGEFRPVLVGLFWPSIALVAPWERGPRIAGGEGAGAEPDSALPEPDEWQAQLRTVAQAVDPAERGRFYELAQRATVAGSELNELAAMLVPVWSGADPVDELGTNPELEPAELVAIWRRTAAAWPQPARVDGPRPAGGGVPPPGPFARTEPGGPAVPGGVPAAASVLDFLDPRNLIVRPATVLQMKDRSGRVGAKGVAALLAGMLGRGSARVHLVGHSYGGKVLLSAVCTMPEPDRPVESVLLLQPAMSYQCFVAKVRGLDRPGGYRPALARERVRQPILATFSSKDGPLTLLFHLAVRRSSDLGEVSIADAPPSRYAALGGYGPPVVGEESQVVAVLAPGEPYDRDPDRRVLGIQATAVIGGHGEVSNPATAWMLVDQVRRAVE